MTIDWASFTPYSALVGGALIGISVGLRVLLLGRVTGISGMIRQSIKATGPARWSNLAFLAGLMLPPALLTLTPWSISKTESIHSSWWLLIIAGLLVGIGTRLGSGCTSGHGVCGNARLSPRSLVATFSFIAMGMITVACLRLLEGAAS
ncbi:YeeE/YedE family protein [Pokkaliibacter sp. CJK22405]|uniref:YeeE/YedE family protein n=1 Tax=Pokkaliibacter sp. CJK22405 TaxID=3384615 RepID=UPI0039848268